MNEPVRKLAEQARIQMCSDARLQEFAELIVFRIMEKLEAEIDTAFQQDEIYAASTLQALSLDILNEFDMELPVDDDWDAEGELQKIIDEFDINSGKKL